MKALLFLFIVSMNVCAHAQTLADDNANSIIVRNDIEFVCDSKTSGLHKESVTITIFNEKGKDAAHFVVQCDQFSTLRKFTGEVIDRFGKTIRKLKKADLNMTEYSSHLVTDAYTYYYDCSAPSYPFTVKYEWEVKYKDGLIGFPPFVPQSRTNQAVAEATYSLIIPAGMNIKYKVFNSNQEPQKLLTPQGNDCYKVIFKDLKAIEIEPFSPSITQLVPYAFFNPIDFLFDGAEGNMTSWATYGQWQSKLLKDRDILPQSIKDKLKELTKECRSDREKVKAVYDYLAQTTRYVSIQLGIGGLQPIPAADVDKTGFGDCKGLTNYMMAMLKELGIPSYYTIIHVNRARMFRDYASANQANHVILQVPLPQDTLWLECTNPQYPFGYIHESIAGHDAILIKEDKGEFFCLPAYPDSLNTQTTIARIALDPTGKSDIKVRQVSNVLQYEQKLRFKALTPDEQKASLRSELRLPQVNITNLTLNEIKEVHPSMDIRYELTSDQYGNRTGNRLFIPTNIFRGQLKYLKKKTRTHDISISHGFVDTENITLVIPEGFAIEALPQSTFVSGNFGSFTALVKQTANEIHLVNRLHIQSGTYSKELYDEFFSFLQTVSNQYEGKIVLRKL